MNIPLRYFFIAMLALALSACAQLAGLEESPRVTLATFKPLEFGLLEQRYSAVLRIQNPNKVPLVIQGLDYTIAVNDRDFARGLSNHDIEIPAFGEQTLEVDMVSTLVSLIEQLRGLESGKLSYRLSGRAAVKGIPGTIAFSHDGELDVDALAPPARSA